MNIQTARVTIDEITWKDAEQVHKIHSIPEVDEFNTLGLPKDLNETKELIQSAIEDQSNKVRKQFAWIVGLKGSGNIIGLCGMFLTADKFKMGQFRFI